MSDNGGGKNEHLVNFALGLILGSTAGILSAVVFVIPTIAVGGQPVSRPPYANKIYNVDNDSFTASVFDDGPNKCYTFTGRQWDNQSVAISCVKK